MPTDFDAITAVTIATGCTAKQAAAALDNGDAVFYGGYTLQDVAGDILAEALYTRPFGEFYTTFVDADTCGDACKDTPEYQAALAAYTADKTAYLRTLDLTAYAERLTEDYYTQTATGVVWHGGMEVD
jgi:hypothetical protein